MTAQCRSQLREDIFSVSVVMGVVIVIFTIGTIYWLASNGAERDNVGRVILIQIVGFVTVLVHTVLTVLHREWNAQRRR